MGTNTASTLETTNLGDRAGSNNNSGASAVSSSTIGGSEVHVVSVDSTDILKYSRRTALNTWTAVAPVTSTTAVHPSVVYVHQNAAVAGDQVYAIFGSSWGTLSYAVWPATAGAASGVS